MPVNRNALIRYKTIDKCLQNHYRTWTLDELIDACSDALYEYEGIEKGVSKRTIQSDIQIMRSDKLGYNAPIIVTEKKYYSYEENDYSITNIPISDQDLDSLYASVELLKQFKGFSHFKELDSMVQKLEDHVYSQKNKQRPIIDFEKNESLKGLEFLDVLYKMIISKKAIQLTYQSFNARQASTFNFHAYLLKEFRNRWFIIGFKNSQDSLMILALDRIVKIEKANIIYRKFDQFSGKEYFRHAIGVSVSPQLSPEKVILFVTHKHAPYILTKPLHSSQKQIDRNYYGITISLKVQLNFELEKEILSFGDGIKVIGPIRLKRNIKSRLKGALDLYDTEINSKGLSKMAHQLSNNGYSLLNKVFTTREVNKLKNEIDMFIKVNNKGRHHIENLLDAIPKIKQMIINKNIKGIIEMIGSNVTLINSSYNDNLFQNETIKNENHKVNMEDDSVISTISKVYFSIRIYLDDVNFTNGALEIFPGSHKNKLTQPEIQIIKNNSNPLPTEVYLGGALLTQHSIIQSIPMEVKRKRGRVIILDYMQVK